MRAARSQLPCTLSGSHLRLPSLLCLGFAEQSADGLTNSMLELHCDLGYPMTGVGANHTAAVGQLSAFTKKQTCMCCVTTMARIGN
jgi:hypothetical protein